MYDDDMSDPMFADPGGRSALRASSRRNPRNRSCPTCKAKNVLTPADVALGFQCDRCVDRDVYQCDRCADRDEGSYVGEDY